MALEQSFLSKTDLLAARKKVHDRDNTEWADVWDAKKPNGEWLLPPQVHLGCQYASFHAEVKLNKNYKINPFDKSSHLSDLTLDQEYHQQRLTNIVFSQRPNKVDIKSVEKLLIAASRPAVICWDWTRAQLKDGERMFRATKEEVALKQDLNGEVSDARCAKELDPESVKPDTKARVRDKENTRSLFMSALDSTADTEVLDNYNWTQLQTSIRHFFGNY